MEGLLPRKLLLARTERGLTLRQAAEKTGVAKETISDLERGLRKPHPPTLYKIAQGYGVSVRDLLEEEPAFLAPARPEPGDIRPDEVLKALLDDGLGHAEILLSGDPDPKMSVSERLRRLVELGDESRYLKQVFLHTPHYVLGRAKGERARVSREEHELLLGVQRAIQDAWRNAERRAQLLAPSEAPSEEEAINQLAREVVAVAEGVVAEARAAQSVGA